MDEQEPKPVEAAEEQQVVDEKQSDKSAKDGGETVETSEQTEEPKVLEAKAPTKNQHKLQRFWAYYKSHKKLAIPLTALALVALILGVPATRYPVLGIALKKDVTVTVLDSKTNKPISSVDLSLAGKIAKTSQDGKATFQKVPVGNKQLKATKKYYQDQTSSAFVPIGSNGSAQISMNATGRQVKVYVFNRLNGKPLKDAKVSAAGTEATTDEKGNTTIVLPADADTQQAKITNTGFNDGSLKIKVMESEVADNENSIGITPVGKIYFLSKRTGKINVMKSNLDGTNAEVVLAATGSEDDGDTIMLASQDWKYLALKSKRNGAGKPASLYLIDTASGDKLTTMDEGDATFTLVGWSGHNFAYQVQRDKVQFWQPNKYSLKSYDAEAGKINVLDNTAGEGSGVSNYYGTDYRSEYYTSPILVGDTLHYGKVWSSGIYTADGSALAGKQSGFYSIKINGQDKKTLKSFAANDVNSMESKLYKPREVYYRTYGKNGTSQFYEVENGAVQTKGDLTAQFYAFYPTYLYDPSNKQTFWAESRDGKNTLFIGDNEGDNSKEIATLAEYAAYGWYTDQYVLLSKNSSELYVTGADKLDTNFITKITDYHKPSTTFYGYGGGYGGL